MITTPEGPAWIPIGNVVRAQGAIFCWLNLPLLENGGLVQLPMQHLVLHYPINDSPYIVEVKPE